MVTIKFTDGTEIEAVQNGTCYITEEKPDFPDDLSVVEVTGEEPENDITFHDAKLIECASVDGRYWFSFTEISASEKEARQVEQNTANIDYIAMMTDVDLPEEVM